MCVTLGRASVDVHGVNIKGHAPVKTSRKQGQSPIPRQNPTSAFGAHHQVTKRYRHSATTRITPPPPLHLSPIRVKCQPNICSETLFLPLPPHALPETTLGVASDSHHYYFSQRKTLMNLTFILSPLPVLRQPQSCIHPFPSNNALPSRSFSSMSLDPNTVGTGYALLDSLKGVVIGPTINEITAAIAGGTVGVMGTIIALEVRRQRVKEHKQCPYCRGTGKLPCAACYTLGAVPCANTVTAQEGCIACQERGYLQCNHVSHCHPFRESVL